MNDLTCIIPFLNEGDEIEKTLDSIRNTAKDEVDIIIVNDNSTDGFNYLSMATKYGAKYFRNHERLGVAASRDLGVERCQTPYFILFDGHMRFYGEWHITTIEALRGNSRAVYCFRCFDLDANGGMCRASSVGAYVKLNQEDGYEIFSPTWRYQNEPELVVKVPCVLGASYAMSKEYYKRLKGLSGLKMYGFDEAYLSMKVFMEGGDNYILSRLEVGHRYRQTPPYFIPPPEFVYNKLFIAETLTPPSFRDMAFENVRKNCAAADFEKATGMLQENAEQIEELKAYYSSIFTRSFEDFLIFNEEHRS
jgi:glycosyltransferase involved in cell wall biosynthesis